MAKYKYIRADVYARGLTVFIGEDEEFIRFIKEAFKKRRILHDLLSSAEDAKNRGTLGTTYLEEDGQSIIHIHKFPETPGEISILTHELLHGVFNLLDYIGVEYHYNGPNEPYTYLLEYFLKEALTEKGYKKY